METRKKKRILNTLMVILILLIAAGGVYAVGTLKGWFQNEKQTQLRSKSVVGIANIERSGVAYSLKNDLALSEQDQIETRQGSTAELAIRDEDSIVMNQMTEMQILTASDSEINLEIKKGEVFADTTGINQGMHYHFDNAEAGAENAVYSISVQNGSAVVNVFKGTVYVTNQNNEKHTVNEKESLLITEDTMANEQLNAENLNEFLILQAQKCKDADHLAFSVEELQKVLDDRAAQKQAALEESLAGQYFTKQNIQKSGTEDNKAQPTKTPDLNSDKSSNADVTEEFDDGNETEDDAYDEQDISEDESTDDTYEADEDSEDDIVSDIRTCTIEIVCDTILDNMENLSPGKEAYVPANGVILSTSTVEFSEGETVFEVLQRVCDAAGIQLEYSYTPIYDSYYIEGINNLYEFDCGNESGWMYQVNGWFPNYGCSAYVLEDGDSIVWCYTCNGLGADL